MFVRKLGIGYACCCGCYTGCWLFVRVVFIKTEIVSCIERIALSSGRAERWWPK